MSERRPMSKKGAGLAFLKDVILRHDADECLTWPFGRTGTGYGMLLYAGRKQLVHRVVCGIVNGPAISPEHEAAHLCGKGHEACCAPRHVAWKTHQENVDDQLRHNTRNRGERQGLSKLTTDDVRAIRASTGTIQTVAAHFGIAASNVSLIRNRKSWAWLQ